MQQSARAGLIFAITGFAILSIGDAVIKTMALDYPAVGAGALRFAIGTLGLSALLLWKEGPGAFIPTHPWLQLARAGCLAGATLTFFSAIYLMPLADAMAIAFLAPVLTAFLSGPILGEKVRNAVWIASVLALFGVGLILRPNLAALGWPAILPLISAAFFALMVVLNRKSAGQGSALSMQVYAAAGAAVTLSVVAGLGHGAGLEGFDLQWPSWDVIARCAFVACTASSAHYLAYLGTMRAGAAQVAPAIYVQILVAAGLGWWWFGDVPDIYTVVGAAIVIAAGLYLWRDSVAGEA